LGRDLKELMTYVPPLCEQKRHFYFDFCLDFRLNDFEPEKVWSDVRPDTPLRGVSPAHAVVAA
jgi:hypothetical protein